MIREATLNDAAALLSIYAPYVSESAESFETQVPSIEEFRARMVAVMGKFPWLVWEREGMVLGYAYAAPFKSRAAYRWSAESTVYVRRDSRGKGIGRALYADLLARLRAQGVLNVIGGITLPNQASVGLHEALGFKFVGKFPLVGFKFGEWRDVGYWQLAWEKPAEPQEVKA